MRLSRPVVLFFLVLLSSCASHNDVSLTEATFSAADLMPSQVQSVANAAEIGISLGSDLEESSQHLKSAGWSLDKSCLMFADGDPCIAVFQRGHEVVWLFLASDANVVSGASLGQCFDCER